jgi:hypothetical protein
VFSRGFIEEFVQDHLQKRHRVIAGKGKQATKTRAKNTDDGSVEHKTDGLPEKETFWQGFGSGKPVPRAARLESTSSHKFCGVVLRPPCA